MIKSMTGFGSAGGEFNGRAVTVEVKSVNNRFREIVARMPRICASLEEAIKKMVAARLERGRIDLWVQIEDREANKKAYKVDFEFASELKSTLDDLKEKLGLAGAVTLDQLLSLGVLAQEPENTVLDELWAVLEPLVSEALDGLVHMRQNEGSNLYEDLEKRLLRLAATNRKVEELASSAPDILFGKLTNRLAELGAGIKVDQNRLAQEIALLADRVDINEEVVRLTSHINRFNEIISDQEATGRRLDFLLQEMGREVNTMGSKTQDLGATGLILDMKADLEKLREQAQNIE